MRVKTSVTLPEELLAEVDALAVKRNGRSAVVESALVAYVAKEKPKRLNRRDIRLINENAETINRQVEETLEFQAEW